MSYQTLFKSTKLQILVVVLLTFLSYSNIFENTYTGGDDSIFIQNWQEGYKLSHIQKIFLEADVPNGDKSTYRPVSTSVIPILHQFTGSNPLGFHVFSLFVIAASIILTYNIIFILSKSKLMAFISALIFGLHPIHAEAITFMLGATDTIGALLYVLSVFCYIKFRSKINQSSKKYLYLSLGTGVLAVYANEIASTLPFMILFYEYIFHNLSFKKLFKAENLKIYSLYFLILISYLLTRFLIIGTATKGMYLADSLYLSLLTSTRILIKYIQILIWPNNLSVYPQVSQGIESYTGFYAPMEKILSQSILDPEVLLNIFILGFLTFFMIKLKRIYPVISFGIGWFFIAILPVSNIVPLNTLIQERYAYLASFGFCFILGYSVQLTAYRFKKNSNILFVSCLLILVSFYSYQTYQRNKDWKDPIAFWSKTTSQVPNFFWANVFLANNLADKGDYDQALKYYKKALEIDPSSQMVLSYIERIENIRD